jgi:hypothetical protein
MLLYNQVFKTKGEVIASVILQSSVSKPINACSIYTFLKLKTLRKDLQNI